MTLRHFLTISDLNHDELIRVLDRASALKALRGAPEHPKPLDGKSIAIVFEKASTRTRLSFEVGIYELGARPVTLISKDTQLVRGEPIEDTARMLSGYVHGVVYRTFGHDRLERLAQSSTIPVVNGLSDRFHPCQLLADLMTVRQSFGPSLKDVRVAWIGDGNNMANSWIVSAALAGFELALACPAGYPPDSQVLADAHAQGANVRLVERPEEAAEGATVVTTDVWASMGQEDEAKERRHAFSGFLVDDAIMKRAGSEAIFLHCLPAHRGEEVSESVIDGVQSRVWDEAENRLHTQKALLEWLIT
ncbi:MAG: ornithine carbamoyltransferase [Myxococcales bacterium]|nr:ornithine carbamoyltransferase [Myxococcales bacterium]MDH3486004.1 ornithine carbamoyltransferase [Myxococcales bacterium]